MLTSSPDIMMLDVLMPGMEGLEAAGEPRLVHMMRCAGYIPKEPGG